MQFNLFTWIREGVRRSVILGVSDAVEAIGVADGDNDVRERLTHLLQPTELEGTAQPALAGATAGKRKRLGRSLRDFDGGEG